MQAITRSWVLSLRSVTFSVLLTPQLVIMLPNLVIFSVLLTPQAVIM